MIFTFTSQATLALRFGNHKIDMSRASTGLGFEFGELESSQLANSLDDTFLVKGISSLDSPLALIDTLRDGLVGLGLKINPPPPLKFNPTNH